MRAGYPLLGLKEDIVAWPGTVYGPKCFDCVTWQIKKEMKKLLMQQGYRNNLLEYKRQLEGAEQI